MNAARRVHKADQARAAEAAAVAVQKARDEGARNGRETEAARLQAEHKEFRAEMVVSLALCMPPNPLRFAF